MMAGEIIRLGDPTSHGGRVLEGSQMDICYDKPIAYVGHQTWCPLCKGSFPIIEGATTTLFYGAGVALSGMKTACGATLIATQFTATVEWSRGDDATPATNTADHTAAIPTPVAQESYDKFAPDGASASSANAPHAFDLFFRVQNEKTGAISPNTPYRIILADGREFRGVTDTAGHTEKVFSDHPQSATIEVPYYDNCHSDATDEPDACCR